MDPEFPSLWLEIKGDNEKDKLVCGFFRDWKAQNHVFFTSDVIDLYYYCICFR